LDIPTSFYKFWKFETISRIKTIENELKFAAQCRAETGPWLQCVARWPAMRGQSEGRLGHGPAARSSRGSGLRAARAGVVTARRRHGGG
jgi:hypothetical protein